jgi:hypothetical protein
LRNQAGRPDPSAGPVRRALRYALYDWTREMSSSKRVLTWMGLLLQGYALYVAITGSLLMPTTWPRDALINAVWLLYLAGYLIINGMLTSAFIPKTQLESDLRRHGRFSRPFSRRRSSHRLATRSRHSIGRTATSAAITST